MMDVIMLSILVDEVFEKVGHVSKDAQGWKRVVRLILLFIYSLVSLDHLHASRARVSLFSYKQFPRIHRAICSPRTLK